MQCMHMHMATHGHAELLGVRGPTLTLPPQFYWLKFHQPTRTTERRGGPALYLQCLVTWWRAVVVASGTQMTSPPGGWGQGEGTSEFLSRAGVHSLHGNSCGSSFGSSSGYSTGSSTGSSCAWRALHVRPRREVNNFSRRPARCLQHGGTWCWSGHQPPPGSR